MTDWPKTSLARRTDPLTSHLAGHAAEFGEAGQRQRERVAAGLARWPGCTSAELARRLTGAGLPCDRYTVARRLPELARAGKAERRDSRICDVTGRPALTWWPTP